MRVTHFVPALVDNAYSNGDVAFSTRTVLFRHRPRHQPAQNVPGHNATDSTVGFHERRQSTESQRVQNLTWRINSRESNCNFVLAWDARSQSNKMRKYSAVMPDGPPAAPRLAESKLVANVYSHKLNKTHGCGLVRSSGIGLLGNRGLFSASVRACNVANVPGANPAPSRTWRAALNSPICTNCNARLTLFTFPLSPRVCPREETTTPSPSNNTSQSPWANRAQRSSNCFFGINPP